MIIAVIDDDALDRQICSTLIRLVSKEVKIIEFSHGRAALQHYFDNAAQADSIPDIVIVDIKMPLMNGWEYLEAYEVMENRLVKKPVHYICTSSIDPKDLTSRQDIVRKVYPKPFEKEYVHEVIKEHSAKGQS